METKKYKVTLKEDIQAGNYRSQLFVDNLCELVEQLEELGISVIDIESSTPYDNLPNLIKSDVSIYDMSESDFDSFTKTTMHKPYITPMKKTLKGKSNNNIETALINGIRKTINRFRERPFYYFTESDIHSSLVKDIMDGNSDSLLHRDKTNNIEISLLHNEYPTNFRYSKSKLLEGYRNIYESGSDDRKETLISSKEGDRGNYDLSIINKEFVERVLENPIMIDKETKRNKVTDLSEAIKHIINKDIRYTLSRYENLKTELSFAVEVKFIHPFNARNKNMLDEVIKDNTKLSLARAHSSGFTKTINLVFCSSEEQERSDDKDSVITNVKEYIKTTKIVDYNKNQYSIPDGVINIFIESYLTKDTKSTPKPIVSIGGNNKNNDLAIKIANSLKTEIKK